MNAWIASLDARVHASTLDHELACGIAPWRSPLHFARAQQLTTDRNRRGLARSLERLVRDSERPGSAVIGAAIAPCHEQVLEARPLIVAIANRLRSHAPVDARGMARLNTLLSDGAGPCYVKIWPDALTKALEEIWRWMSDPA